MRTRLGDYDASTEVARALVALAREHGAPNHFYCWEVDARTNLGMMRVGRVAKRYSSRILHLCAEAGVTLASYADHRFSVTALID